MGKRRSLLTSTEAAERLGVKPATLYAYVSRGLLESHEGDEPRERLYRRDQVEALRERRARRRDPARVSAGALAWGLPVLESSIGLISEGSLYYRGLEVGRLARERRVEEVASWLWRGSFEAADLFPARAPSPSGAWRRVLDELADRHPGERLQIALRYAAVHDAAAMDLRPERIARAGARLLTLLVETAAGVRKSGRRSLLEPLVEAWVPDLEGGERLLHGALVLCADHELNVSSFTARCVASAGSSPYEAVAAGLGALRGFRHGGYSDRVAEMLLGLGVDPDARRDVRPVDVQREVETRLQRGERVPGFGHPLYPAGDPRCRVLLALLDECCPGNRAVAGARVVAEQVAALIDVPPNVDFALATTSCALRLAPGGAFTLFALGRTMGWIAHVIEEVGRARLIRPRARYVGPPPRADGEGGR